MSGDDDDLRRRLRARALRATADDLSARYQIDKKTNLQRTTSRGNYNAVVDAASAASAASTCSICLDSLAIGLLLQHKCGHIFHKECIERWLLESSRCPWCRNAFGSKSRRRSRRSRRSTKNRRHRI